VGNQKSEIYKYVQRRVERKRQELTERREAGEI
jgi:hypothetical protein